MDFLLLPNCLPFTIALGCLVFLSLYQIGSLVFGLSLPGVLDIPDLPDVEWMHYLDWLNLGRVPIVVTLMVFFWIFGAVGLILQNVLLSALEWTLPRWIAIPSVAVIAVTSLHWVIPPVARLLPKDETSAIDEDYVGRTAVITIGVARADLPAEARTRDRFGRDRYLQVVPDLPDETLPSGQEVLIVSKRGHLHTAIRKES